MRSLRLKENQTKKQVTFETIPTLRGRVLVDDGMFRIVTTDEAKRRLSAFMFTPRQMQSIHRWLSELMGHDEKS